MNISLLDIYKKFVKIGAILIGGGYVILPILKREIVEKDNWISDGDLVNMYVISQSLPGIIAANISLFIGYKLKRVSGAISSILGIITVPFLTILLIYSVISRLCNSIIVKDILWGVSIGVIILVFSSIKELWSKSIVDKFTFILFALLLFTILKWSISPSLIVLLSIFIGVTYKSIERRTKS